ncbi:rhamnogalacturonan endolyase family protein [Streptomyces sp. NPDC003016]
MPRPVNKAATALAAARVAEKLDRGPVAVPASGGVLVTWRMLGSDTADVSFKLYRGGTPIQQTQKTNHLDTAGNTGSSYELRAVVGGVEQPGEKAGVWASGRLDIPLDKPPGRHDARRRRLHLHLHRQRRLHGGPGRRRRL